MIENIEISESVCRGCLNNTSIMQSVFEIRKVLNKNIKMSSIFSYCTNLEVSTLYSYYTINIQLRISITIFFILF